MAYPTVQGRSDPRVLCGILASEALPQLEHAGTEEPSPDKQAIISLVNLVRLLDMYRYGVMRDLPRPRGIAVRQPTTRLDLIGPKTDHYKSLEAIMDAARFEVFGLDSDKERDVVIMRDVLIFTIDGYQSDEVDATKTYQFFATCVRLIQNN